jgi:hypothetical protein
VDELHLEWSGRKEDVLDGCRVGLDVVEDRLVGIVWVCDLRRSALSAGTAVGSLPAP